MSKIIAGGLQKGGTTKTTTTANVAGIAAQVLSKKRMKRAHKVLLIDFDPQASATRFFFEEGAVPWETSLACLFDLDNPERIVRERREIIRPTRCGNLFVAPSSIALAAAEARRFPSDQERLKIWIEANCADFDLIIIDTPPSLGILTTNALMAAQHVVIVTQPEPCAVEDSIPMFIRTVEDAKTDNPDLSVLGVVINLFAERQGAHKLYKEVLEGMFPGDILGVIHRAAYMVDLAAKRMLLSDVATTKRERAYKEYRATTVEILHRIGYEDA